MQDQSSDSHPSSNSVEISAEPMVIRVGFIIGKEFDFVDTPDSKIDTSFLHDLPASLRVRPRPRFNWPGMTKTSQEHVSADVAIAWYIHKYYPDIIVDFISPGDISLVRLQSNLCNFIIGYDILDAMCEGRAIVETVTHAFKLCGNIIPSWDVQESIYMKSKYMKEAIRLGVPIAPTIFAPKEIRDPLQLLKDIKIRGWQYFVIKQSYNFGSAGFIKFSVAACEENPVPLFNYFQKYENCPEFIVQEFISGFCRNWEVRCFWFNSKFQYAIANRAAVSCGKNEENNIISEKDIPLEFLENAKRVGEQALAALPILEVHNQPLGMTLVRTDVGCADCKVDDKDTHWDPNVKTFFLNEIEYGGTTYFCRILDFDSMPMYGELYASKAMEIFEKTVLSPTKKTFIRE